MVVASSSRVAGMPSSAVRSLFTIELSIATEVCTFLLIEDVSVTATEDNSTSVNRTASSSLHRICRCNMRLLPPGRSIAGWALVSWLQIRQSWRAISDPPHRCQRVPGQPPDLDPFAEHSSGPRAFAVEPHLLQSEQSSGPAALDPRFRLLLKPSRYQHPGTFLGYQPWHVHRRRSCRRAAPQLPDGLMCITACTTGFSALSASGPASAAAPAF